MTAATYQLSFGNAASLITPRRTAPQVPFRTIRARRTTYGDSHCQMHQQLRLLLLSSACSSAATSWPRSYPHCSHPPLCLPLAPIAIDPKAFARCVTRKGSTFARCVTRKGSTGGRCSKRDCCYSAHARIAPRAVHSVSDGVAR